jgi:ribosomal protein S12 methylthiotransferase
LNRLDLKTKGLKKDKINVITLGCSKNLVDSEVLITQLKSNGLQVEHESPDDDSNIVIINTCGFIDNAKKESIDTILRFANAKQDGLIEKLYVTGCLSERYRNELQKDIPEVDAFFGTRELPSLLKKFNADYKHELIGERNLTTAPHYAYIKISEGCDRPCSFCAIPLMRGKHVSRPVEELVKEASGLARNGVKELILIAQDSTYYGLDLYKKRSLAYLLSKLAEVDGIEWIRLHYAFPTGFPMDVIDAMAANTKICNYLDIPFQHGSNKILELMRRGTTAEKAMALIDKIRDKIPDIAIRTTMLVGHPGEVKKDFELMLQFIEKLQFDRLGVFLYSHEEDTYSFTMKDNVPDKVKQQRAKEVLELQESISLKKNIQKIGRTFKVLIDRKEAGYFIGRTEYDSPDVDNEVLVKANGNYLRTGDFANISIIDAQSFDLIGEPAS